MTTGTTTQRAALEQRLADLNDELADIDERRAAIEGQISKAIANQKLTGTYADSDWFRRARGAKRHLGVERSRVCTEIGEANRAIRRLNQTLSRDSFAQAVRETVDPQTLRRIFERQHAIEADQ